MDDFVEWMRQPMTKDLIFGTLALVFGLVIGCGSVVAVLALLSPPT